MALFKKEKTLVCMELRGNSIRFIELKSTSPLVVKQYGEKEVPKGIIEERTISDLVLFKQFIQGCLEEWKLKKKKIAFIQPNETVIVKKIQVPKDIPHEELHGYIYLELGVTIHLPFEHPAMDFVILGENEETQDVLLVATREDLINTTSSAIKHKNNEALIADIAPLCYYRLYDFVKEHPNPEEIMIVDVDSNSATISIFENHVPVFMQFEELVIEQQSNWMMDEMHIVGYQEDAQAVDMTDSFIDLLDNIDRINHFYQFSLSQGKEVKKIIIVGDNPQIETLVMLGNDRYGIPYELIEDGAEVVEQKYLPKAYQGILGLALRVV